MSTTNKGTQMRTLAEYKTNVWTEEYQNNLDIQVMKELDFSKKEFNKLSEEWKEKFRKQIDGNYADAMESCD